ncbi:LuxR family transcriptional regulator [Paractinoplanes globisporus]|uniref:AAA family ATPase n=1 Tax=Paractinoplanes globisporus TaxID=113565 RepID=A0ABW6WW83_9ACTN|nr:LuxR family transcriptional regulator [Actinoplanes globisporus]
MALVGREDQLTICRDAVQESRGAFAAVLVGAPGVGKTSLLRAVTAAAARAGRQVLATTGLPGGAGVPMGNLADLLGMALPSILPELPGLQADALRTTFRLASAPAVNDELLVALATMNAMRALCANRPVVVAIDDAQWMDRDSERLLTVLVNWLRDLPIGWMLTVRSGYETAGLSGTVLHDLGRDAITVTVSPLDDVSLYQVIAERFPGPWRGTLISRIVALSGGNPYAAVELARETVASGGYDAPVAMVPPSLTVSLNARLRRLKPTAGKAARLVALVAQPDRRLLRKILGPGADDAIDQAFRAGVLHDADTEGHLALTHPLLAEIVQRSMTWSDRRSAHRALADGVDDADEAAGHLAQSTDDPDDAISLSVWDAAWRMSQRGIQAGAAALGEAALRLTPADPERTLWRRRTELLDLLEKAGELDKALRLADLWLADKPPDDGRIRGRLTFYRGLMETDILTSNRLVAQAVDQLWGDRSSQTHAAALQGYRLLGQWRVEEAQPFIERATQLAGAGVPDEVRRWVGAVCGAAASVALDPQAGDLLREAMRQPGADRMWVSVLCPEMELAFWHLGRGEVTEAGNLFDRVRGNVERSNEAISSFHIEWGTLILDYMAGRWDQVEARASSLLRYAFVFREIAATDRVLVETVLAAVRGRATEARRLVPAALAAVAAGDLVTGVFLRSHAAHLELSIGDPPAAVDWLDPVAAQMRGRAYSDVLILGVECDLIEGYARVGRTAEAEERLAWLRTTADRLEHPLGRLAGSRCAAVLALARGDPRAALTELDPMLPEARRSEVPLEKGRFLLTFGSAQRRARLRRAAAASIDEAIEVFAGLGAQAWAAQARAERAKLAHLSDGTLTPTEQRIADLVRLGRTNAEIATTLLLREKTVEGNLTRIYRKLCIRGRKDLIRMHR